MLITKRELFESGASSGVRNRYMDQTGSTDLPVNVMSLVGTKFTPLDLLWVAKIKMPKETLAQYSCNCATLMLDKVKEACAKDLFARFEKFLKFPTNDLAREIEGDAYRAAVDARQSKLDELILPMWGVFYAARAVLALDSDRPLGSYSYAASICGIAGRAGLSQDQIEDLSKSLFC